MVSEVDPVSWTGLVRNQVRILPLLPCRRNCSDLKGYEDLKVEDRERTSVADVQADGFQTAFDQFDPPSLNSYPDGGALTPPRQSRYHGSTS